MKTISWVEDTSALSPGIPISALYKIGHVKSFSEKPELSDRAVEGRMMQMISATCSELIPGMPGGGRLILEVPISVPVKEISTTCAAIKAVVESRVRETLYKNSQSASIDVSQWKMDDAENEINEHYNISDRSEYVEKFSSLPECGGNASVCVGITARGRARSLTLVVDSFWNPSCTAFCSTLMEYGSVMVGAAASHSSSARMNDEVLESIRTSLGYTGEQISFSGYVPISSGRMKEASTALGKCHGFFSSACVEYAEAMSLFHRRCVATYVLNVIFEEVNVRGGRSLIPDLKDWKSSVFIPTLSSAAAEAASDSSLYIETPTALRLVSSAFYRDSLHTTRRIVSIGGSSVPSVVFVKGQFLTNDVCTGAATISFGGVGHGYFSMTVRGENMERRKSHSSRMHVDPRYESSSRSTCSGTRSMVASDVFLPGWLTSRECSGSSPQPLYGLKFDATKKIEDPHDYIRRMTREPSRTSEQGPDKMRSTASSCEDVVTLQPYVDIADLGIGSSRIGNEHDSLYAIHEFLIDLGVTSFEARSLHVPQISIVEPIVTVVSSKPLSKYSIDELVRGADRRRKSHMFLSNEHFSQIALQGKARTIIGKSEEIKYGDTPDRLFHKVPVSDLKLILKK